MRALLCLLLFIPVMPAVVLSDVVIELTSGERIVVPVDQADVARISFSEGDASGSQEAAARSSGSDGSTIWRVGPDRELKFPSEAAGVARDGDTIEIDAGVYRNDYTRWTQNDLTIRGVGGMAHLKSSGLIPNGKAIWITRGHRITMENIEFSGAAVRDTNGAGIRHEGGDLLLKNTFFHHNEFSILSGSSDRARIEIQSSRFWFHKRPKRHSHGIYIGAIESFTLVGSHVKGTDQGHQVKTRARLNRILYNRIEDPPGGNSSRLIDLSNCGLSFVIGNDLHQAASVGNFNIIGYGPEKCPNRTGEQMRLYVVNNTLVNEARNGTFVNNHAGGEVLVANNLVFGRARILVGSGVENNNVNLDLDDRPTGSWGAPPGSPAVDAGQQLPAARGTSLVPTMEFHEPLGTRQRKTRGRLDIGSREVGG